MNALNLWFGYVFENSKDPEILEICSIYKTPTARTPTLLKAKANLRTRAVPSAPVDSSVYIKVRNTVWFWSILALCRTRSGPKLSAFVITSR